MALVRVLVYISSLSKKITWEDKYAVSTHLLLGLLYYCLFIVKAF